MTSRSFSTSIGPVSGMTLIVMAGSSQERVTSLTVLSERFETMAINFDLLALDSHRYQWGEPDKAALMTERIELLKAFIENATATDHPHDIFDAAYELSTLVGFILGEE